jgi:hypothetical protein
MSSDKSNRKVGEVAIQERPLIEPSGNGKKASGRTVGGVAAYRSGAKSEGVGIEVAPPSSGPAAPAHADFAYHGGPVISCPFMYTSFWGSLWQSDPAHLQEAGRLSQFCKDLVNSDYMNVLSQYGVGSGKGSGLFMQASFVSNVPANLTDSGIHTIIQNCINAGAIPEPPQNNRTNVLIIYLDENTAVQDPGFGISMCEPSGDNAFGYHFDFTTAKGNPFYYAVIPALDDKCLQNTCGGSPTCSLHPTQTQEQRRTQVTSHEFAEMCTDPKFKTGWWGPSSDENGDICNGEADNITVGPNTWDVQRQYSKFDDINSNGATFCVTTAPNPIPKLSPGPSGINAAMASAQRIGNYNAFLPLPTAHYDVKSGKFSLDESEVNRYFRSFFYPLSPENFFADFPGTLRNVADVLEKASKKKGKK